MSSMSSESLSKDLYNYFKVKIIMKLKTLLTIASIPFLLSPKLKAENYSLVPDSSYHMSYLFHSERVYGIYQGSYSLKPKEDYIPLNELKIESAKNSKTIQEIMFPLLNKICESDRGITKIRPSVENLLQSSITTDIGILLLFDTYFSDNNLAVEENYFIRLLLKEKTAIAFYMKEKVPTDNSFPGKEGCVEYPYIIFFEPDTTTIPLDSILLESLTEDLPEDSLSTETKKDSIIPDSIPKSTQDSTPALKKKTWRDFKPRY
mgnify:FL=1